MASMTLAQLGRTVRTVGGFDGCSSRTVQLCTSIEPRAVSWSFVVSVSADSLLNGGSCSSTPRKPGELCARFGGVAQLLAQFVCPRSARSPSGVDSLAHLHSSSGEGSTLLFAGRSSPLSYC